MLSASLVSPLRVPWIPPGVEARPGHLAGSQDTPGSHRGRAQAFRSAACSQRWQNTDLHENRWLQNSFVASKLTLHERETDKVVNHNARCFSVPPKPPLRLGKRTLMRQDSCQPRGQPGCQDGLQIKQDEPDLEGRDDDGNRCPTEEPGPRVRHADAGRVWPGCGASGLPTPPVCPTHPVCKPCSHFGTAQQ